MSITNLTATELSLTISPDTLGFTDTSELLEYDMQWIGQERAEMAARFGLGTDQPDFNLFVLGEVGSGRSSLLKQAMQAARTHKAGYHESGRFLSRTLSAPRTGGNLLVERANHQCCENNRAYRGIQKQQLE